MRTAVIPESFAAFSLKGVAASANEGISVPSNSIHINKNRIIKASEAIENCSYQKTLLCNAFLFYIKSAQKKSAAYELPRFSSKQRIL
jgi:hypothetical protein